MTEIRMTNDERNPKARNPNQPVESGIAAFHSAFGFRYSFGIRHSCFVIIQRRPHRRFSGQAPASSRVTKLISETDPQRAGRLHNVLVQQHGAPPVILTATVTAFKPGQSPPPVRMPMRSLISLLPPRTLPEGAETATTITPTQSFLAVCWSRRTRRGSLLSPR